jgi:hemolysin activation/secretion protein
MLTMAIVLGQPQMGAAQTQRESLRFELRELRFEGNTVLSSELLTKLTASWIGQSVDFNQLDEIAARITSEYRKKGYLFAQALIPEQQVEDGVVKILILEGRLGRIIINRAPNAPVSQSQIREILSPLHPGDLIRQDAIERVLLLLSDIPGISVQSSFQVGQEAGLTDLSVDVELASRFNGQLDADNYGIASSGEYRFGGSLRWNGPLGYGDKLDLKIMQATGDLTYGRVGYDFPIGGRGARFAANYSHLHYGLGQAFFALQSYGSADAYDLSVSYPLIRSRSENLAARLSGDYQQVDDTVAAVSLSSDRHIPSSSAALEYERYDSFLGGGYTGGTLILTYGDVSFANASQLALDQGPGGRSTAGNFSKFNLQLSRLQNITGPHNIFVGIAGQWASQNLDNVERVPVGGPQGVRAYAVSAVVADEAIILRAEYRYNLKTDIVLSAFYDEGWSQVNRYPLPGQTANSPQLAGAGLGFFWGKAGNFSVQASIAWRTTPAIPQASPSNYPTIFVQLAKMF